MTDIQLRVRDLETPGYAPGTFFEALLTTEEKAQIAAIIHCDIQNLTTIKQILDRLIDTNQFLHRPNYLKNIIDNEDSSWCFAWLNNIACGCGIIAIAIDIDTTFTTWLFEKILLAAKNYSYLLIAVQLGNLIKTLWYSSTHEEKQSEFKLTKLACDLVRISLIISAYILSEYSAFCPILFIVASILDAAETAYEYFMMHPLAEGASLEEQNQYKLLSQQRLCNLIASVLILTCTTCFVVFPPSIMLIVLCTLLTFAISTAKEQINARLSDQCGNELQDQLYTNQLRPG